MCRGNLHSVTVNVKCLAVAQATPLTCPSSTSSRVGEIEYIIYASSTVMWGRGRGTEAEAASGRLRVAGCGLRLANVGADEDEGDVVIRSLAKNELIKCVYVMKLYVKCVDNE